MDEMESSEEVPPIILASRALMGITARSMSDDIPPAQWRFMIAIYTSSGSTMRLTDIAQRVSVNLSTASRTCDKLVRARVVRRTKDPTDKRMVQVALTRRGERIITEVHRRRSILIEEVMSRLSPEDQQRVNEGMALFATAAGEERDPPSSWARWR